MMNKQDVLNQLKKDAESKKCKECGNNLTFRSVSIDGVPGDVEIGTIDCYCKACGTDAKLKVHIKI